MIDSLKEFEILVLDVSTFTYAERLCAAALQGLFNRSEARVFLDYGIYDDPNARKTNEVFMDDETWFGKYREMLGNQDQRNLDDYRQRYGFEVRHLDHLVELVKRFAAGLQGLVIWDEDMPDTANIALMLCAQESLLPVTADMIAKHELNELPVRHDLRGRWQDRVALYTWAFAELFPKCKPGFVACLEPGWQRPEFVDYVVQQKIFTYSLSSREKGLGSSLLLLLTFGPRWLRELIFTLRLDGPLRRYALHWMAKRSTEVALSNRIQRAVKSPRYPTIFGWHTLRDDELAFMLQLSSNGLRLVPCHLAGNFSFQGQLPAEGVKQPPLQKQVQLDPQGLYLTFTLSDGDQLMMMNTGELGNWYTAERGKVPFNWEVQPLLMEIAPALLEKYLSGVTENDCLIAGPSGAGYIIPPLTPTFDHYMEETTRLCQDAGITVINPYVADLPARTLATLGKHKGGLLGFLSGYAVIEHAPLRLVHGAPYAANLFPKVDQIWYSADELLSALRVEMDKDLPRPRFIGIHLFAYRTTIRDVLSFARGITDAHVHIVRGDELLMLAGNYLQEKS